jgi:lysozyme
LGLSIAASIWWGWRDWRPSKSDYPQQGVEVSATSGEIIWLSVKAAGADFAYIDASFGDTERNPAFAAQWQDSAIAGLTRGAVHRFHLCRLARDQATNFIAMVPREADELPPALDLDLDAGCAARPARSVLLAEIASFIQMVEAHVEKPVMIRVSSSFEAEYSISRAIDRPLWLSSRVFTPSYGERPWVMWQANPARPVDGIDKPVGWSVVRP